MSEKESNPYEGFSKDTLFTLEELDFHIGNIGNVKDNFVNAAARLGAGTDSLTDNSRYELTRLTYDYRTLTTLYRNSWISNKIVRIPAQDMVRAGINIITDLPPEEMEKVQRKFKQQHQNLIDGIQWGRLYGGALGIPLIAGITDSTVKVKSPGGDGKTIQDVNVLELPFNPKYITPGSFKGLFIVDKWNGISPSGENVSNIGDGRFGLPEYFTVSLEGKKTLKIHHSWLLEFIGLSLPRLEKYSESYWGMSALEPVYEELKKYDGTNYSIAELVYKASLRVVKFNDFENALKGKNDKEQQALRTKIETLKMLQSSNSLLALDKEDEFENHSTSFGSLDAIMNEFKINISGASELTMSKLFGKQSSGIGGEDATSLINYYDFIDAENERVSRGNYNKLLQIIALSELGKPIEDLDFDFNYLGEVSNSNNTKLAIEKITAVKELFVTGILDIEVTLQTIREIGKKHGIGDNITKEYIDKIKEEAKFNYTEEESEPDDDKAPKGLFGKRKKKKDDE